MLYERHGGAAAVAAAAAAAGRAAAAAAYSDSDDEGEEQTCTCGQCLDGWLSLAFSTAVAAVAAKAREAVDRVLQDAEQTELDNNMPLRRQQRAKALSQAAALRALSQTSQLTIDFLRVYSLLLQAVDDLIAEGIAPDSGTIWSRWSHLVEERVKEEEQHLCSVRDGNQDAQTQAVAFLIRQARKELEQDGEDLSCENDDDYAGVAEQMLGLSEKEAVEWIESDSGTSDSDGGRGINGVDPDDSGDYDEDAAHGSEDEDYEDSEEADDE